MRSLSLSLALIPAALVAQTPAQPDYASVLKQETPGIETLLKDGRPLEAFQKAESLVPAALPAFDKRSPATALKASVAFSGLTGLYLLDAKAAGQAGDWEKVLELRTKAQDCAKVNYESTREALTPLQASWTQAIEKATKDVSEQAETIKAIQAKPGRTPQEEQEYQVIVAKFKLNHTTTNQTEKNDTATFLKANLARYKALEAMAVTPQEQQDLNAYKVAQGNLAQGPRTVKDIQDNIDATKREYDSLPPTIESIQKVLKLEGEELAKGIAETKVNGKLVKETTGPKHDACQARYFENQLNFPDNYTSRKTRLEKLNFLFRMRHHVAGTPLAAKVDLVIDRVRADQDPLPPDKKAGKGKKAQ